MKDKVIINVSTEKYFLGVKRLKNTLNNFFDGDFLFYSNENELGAPKHFDNPYAFKTYAFNNALKLGYKKILWLDASVYAVKDITPAWDIIEKTGFLMQHAGWNCGSWSNDNCLNYFNITRDKAMQMPMYGNAGLLGLNFNFDISNIFFEQWHKASIDNVFIGNWSNDKKTESSDERCLGHRHDMVAGSIIANKLKMNCSYVSQDQIMQYGASEEVPLLNETIVLKAQGIC